MYSFNKIEFRARLSGISNEDILNNFKKSFEASKCDKVEIVNNCQILVTNEWIRFAGKENLWSSGSNAKVNVEKLASSEKEVIYIVNSYTSFISLLFLVAILYLKFSNFQNTNELAASIPFMMMLLVSIVRNFLSYFRHKALFKHSLDPSKRFLGGYDWENIIKNKSDIELKNIIRGNSALTDEVKKIAEIEFERRKLVKNSKFTN